MPGRQQSMSLPERPKTTEQQQQQHPKNALNSLPQTHAACFQKFPILRNYNEPCDHLMNINETQ